MSNQLIVYVDTSKLFQFWHYDILYSGEIKLTSSQFDKPLRVYANEKYDPHNLLISALENWLLDNCDRSLSEDSELLTIYEDFDPSKPYHKLNFNLEEETLEVEVLKPVETKCSCSCDCKTEVIHQSAPEGFGI